jgi:hexokinase
MRSTIARANFLSVVLIGVIVTKEEGRKKDSATRRKTKKK